MSEHDALELLKPGGGLQGPLFGSLLDRLIKAPTELEAGARVGPYRVVETLGSGGMAVVYLAARADGEFEQRVALKLVMPNCGMSTEEARELLRRERQILASLAHPRIARLLDGGTTEDGALWFAMEAVEGERIDRWCAARAADRRQRLALFQQVCDAVQFAHVHLLVHRDLKPSNILVTPNGDVKLLDFGIAAVVQPGHEHATPRALTPGYASPEQRRGEVETTASDVWQLGRLLELLVRPLAGRRSRDLDAIVARATVEDPARRYGSVTALRDDVERHLEHRPVVARAGGAAYRFGRLLRRNSVASVVALAAMIVLLTAAGLFTAQLVEERNHALEEAARARAARQFMVEAFRSSDPETNRGDTMTANQILERGRERLEREYQDQPALQADLLRAIGVVYSNLGELERAQRLFDAAIEANRRNPKARANELGLALNDAAVVRLRRGLPREAVPLLEEALRFDDAFTGEERSHILLTFASLKRRLGDAIGARHAYENLLDVVGEGSDHERRVRAYAQAFLCELGEQFGDAAAAVRRCREAVDTYARITDPRANQEHVQFTIAYAAALASAGRVDEARAAWQPAYEQELKAYGDGHQRTRYALVTAARIERAAGRLDAAAEMLDRAEAEPFPHEGRDAILADTTLLRGKIALERGDHDAAIEPLEQARAYLARRVDPSHGAFAEIDLALGRALCASGRIDDGRVALAASLAAQTRHPYLARHRASTQATLDACRADAP